MKKILSAAIAITASFGIASSAQAKPITYEYTATIRNIMFSNPSQPQAALTTMDAAQVLGYTVANGTRVTGRFTYFSETARTPYSGYEVPGQVHWYEDNVHPNFILANFDGGLSFQSTLQPDTSLPDTRIRVMNNWYGDTFEFHGFTYGADGTEQSAELSLQDPTGAAFDTTDIPSLLNLDAFQHRLFRYQFVTGNFQSSYFVDADITSMQAIPEPAAALLMLSGLGLLAATRRRKASGSI